MDQANNKMVNSRAEFFDRNLEQEYFKMQLKGSNKYIRFVILIASFAYLAIAIFDYNYNDNFTFFLRSTIARALVFVLGILCFWVMKKESRAKLISICITAFPVLLTWSYIYILAQQGAQGFTNQAMAIMVIMFCTTLLPNRWAYSLLMDILIVGSFLLAAPTYIVGLDWNDYVEVCIYLVLTMAFTATTQYRLNFTQRVRFIREHQLETQSVTDALTGLYNRLWFDETLAKWCSESDKDFSLVIMDVDNFKRVNDNYGHIAGDRVLIEGTEVIQQNIRKNDMIARWGGESAESIIRRADQQLYIAKNNGKNQVAFA